MLHAGGRRRIATRKRGTKTKNAPLAAARLRHSLCRFAVLKSTQAQDLADKALF